jgi:PAS domain S-box-containing protein
MGTNPPTGGPPEEIGAENLFNRIQLRPQEARELFKTSPMPLWLFSSETLLFLDVNPAAVNMYGYTREEFLTKTAVELFAEDGIGPFLQALRGTQPGFVRAGVWRHQNKDGKWMDVDLVWASLVLDNQPCRLMLANEITERRWAEQLLAQVHAHTEEQLAARTMELEVAAQELESFAQALSKMAGQLPSGPEPPQPGSAGRRLEQMSSSLLRLVQLTYRPAGARDVDLSEIAQTVGAEMERRDPQRKVQFRIQPGIRAHADPELMELVMTHLFRNAWIYTRQDAPAVIEFGARHVDAEVVCFVRDDGVGFEPAMAAKLFLPFQRFNPEHTGEGIGLSIVRRIIAKHTGRTWAEGTPNRGATIFFTLPTATTG